MQLKSRGDFTDGLRCFGSVVFVGLGPGADGVRCRPRYLQWAITPLPMSATP